MQPPQITKKYFRIWYLSLLLMSSLISVGQPSQSNKLIFQAGAATSVITPKIGSSINGNMRDVSARHIHDDTHARCIVMDDGKNQLAIVVSDLCMVYRETIDAAKRRAHMITGMPQENMLMSVTHTHSAGTACAVFQSNPDPAYQAFLSERMADAIVRAYNNLEPAQIGWGYGKESTQVFNRRWHMKPGTDLTNPFGHPDQVKMNPGVGNPNLLKPAGPIDPEVAVVSIQTKAGTPLALLANYSLHYVGGTGPGEVSADYYGVFCKQLSEIVGPTRSGKPFVAIMSNGTSGDINNINWSAKEAIRLPHYAKMNQVANILVAEVSKVLQLINYRDWVPLASQTEEITLGVRKPKQQEIDVAKDRLAKVESKVLQTLPDIYARETILLNDYPSEVPLLLQALRIGDLGIVATPCEMFVEIGLEIKEQSPFEQTFSISLANGYNGYLPTPKHHELGGYETWRARSSYLEKGASPKITTILFKLLDNLHQLEFSQGNSN